MGGGEPAVGAGGVQRAQHPPGCGAPAGAAGSAAAAAAGAGDRHLPCAQGALLAVLRSVPEQGRQKARLSLALRGCGSPSHVPASTVPSSSLGPHRAGGGGLLFQQPQGSDPKHLAKLSAFAQSTLHLVEKADPHKTRMCRHTFTT